MAYTYSTKQSFGSSNSYGNVAMDVNIYRGDVTRTETGVSFKFGVCFTPTQYNTTNSVAAWYNGVQRFAYANSGYEYDDAPVRANKNTTYHAKLTNRNSTAANTSEYLCFEYSSSSISASTTSVKVSVGVGWKNWAGDNKGTLTFSVAIPEYYESGSAPTIKINDNGNNGFYFWGVLGTNGVNNKLKSVFIYYTTDGKTPTANSTKITLSDVKASSSYTFRDSPIRISKKCTVKAWIICTYEKPTGKVDVRSKEAEIIYHVAPNEPGTPVLYATRSRFTAKDRIIYNWTAASPGNADSPVMGYRIKLYKKEAGSNLWISIPIYNDKGTLLSTNTGASTPNHIYDSETPNITQISLDQKIHGFVAGDSVKLSVQAYSRLGLNNNGDTMPSYSVSSVGTLIQNAGIVHVKADGGWKEGQVWVRVNNTWHEAETVNIKTPGGWKESE